MISRWMTTDADDGSSKVGQATVTPVGVHRNRSNRSAERSLNRMKRPRSPADMVSAHPERRGARPTLMSSRSSARPGDNPGTIRDSIRALAGNARSATESIARLPVRLMSRSSAKVILVPPDSSFALGSSYQCVCLTNNFHAGRETIFRSIHNPSFPTLHRTQCFSDTL